MELYLAPMEAITGYIFRNAYEKNFGHADKYFTPFIANKKLNSKEKNDCCPEHNQGMEVVPQILTNRVEDFLSIAEQLKQSYGYKEVNFNLGCPSGTVVAKNRGSGFLRDLTQLSQFLDEVSIGLDKMNMQFSIKTRIGLENCDDWEEIVDIYNRYPLTELIIHPRCQVDGYSGRVNMDAFKYAVNKSIHPVCYNGDIKTREDYIKVCQNLGLDAEKNIAEIDDPKVKSIMCGRGILTNPGLLGEIRGRAPITIEEKYTFLNDVYQGYREVLSGDRNVIFKMKELWAYLALGFSEPQKVIRLIRKVNSCSDYETAVRMIKGLE